MTIVKINNTIDDIKSLPFLKAVRQMSLQLERHQTTFMHLTLMPFITTASKLKTKPTQHSIQKLHKINIIPNTLLCHTDQPIPNNEHAKISIFSNIPLDTMISI